MFTKMLVDADNNTRVLSGPCFSYLCEVINLSLQLIATERETRKYYSSRQFLHGVKACVLAVHEFFVNLVWSGPCRSKRSNVRPTHNLIYNLIKVQSTHSTSTGTS